MWISETYSTEAVVQNRIYFERTGYCFSKLDICVHPLASEIQARIPFLLREERANSGSNRQPMQKRKRKGSH